MWLVASAGSSYKESTMRLSLRRTLIALALFTKLTEHMRHDRD